MYTPLNPKFYCIRVGFKGVKTIYACFRDVFFFLFFFKIKCLHFELNAQFYIINYVPVLYKFLFVLLGEWWFLYFRTVKKNRIIR